MQTITIISGTNRPGSYTQKVALEYKKVLESKGFAPLLLSLAELPPDMSATDLYGKRSAVFEVILQKYIDNSTAFLIAVPEYNGSFPGIFKLFIDAVHPSKWADKDVCLVGVSTGRAGNLRGMEHLTSILNYLKMHVFHNKLPISQVDKLYDGQAELLHEETHKAIERQLEGFLKFIQ
ncbi:MAG: NADPH-dependent FMN reductase [Bacteroidia bacterium]